MEARLKGQTDSTISAYKLINSRFICSRKVDWFQNKSFISVFLSRIYGSSWFRLSSVCVLLITQRVCLCFNQNQSVCFSSVCAPLLLSLSSSFLLTFSLPLLWFVWELNRNSWGIHSEANSNAAETQLAALWGRSKSATRESVQTTKRNRRKWPQSCIKKSFYRYVQHVSYPVPSVKQVTMHRESLQEPPAETEQEQS